MTITKEQFSTDDGDALTIAYLHGCSKGKEAKLAELLAGVEMPTASLMTATYSSVGRMESFWDEKKMRDYAAAAVAKVKNDHDAHNNSLTQVWRDDSERIKALTAELAKKDEWQGNCLFYNDLYSKAKEEIEALKARLDALTGAIGNAQLAAFIEKHGDPVPLVAERDALAAKVDVLREALGEAKTGLEWYQETHPESVDGSDDEAMQRIDAALEATE